MKLIFCVFFSVTLSLGSWPAAAEVARRDEERGPERGAAFLAWPGAEQGFQAVRVCWLHAHVQLQEVTPRSVDVGYRHEFVELIFLGEELQLAWVFWLGVFRCVVSHLRPCAMEARSRLFGPWERIRR